MINIIGIDGVDVEILQIPRRTHCERLSFLSVRTPRSSILENPRFFRNSTGTHCTHGKRHLNW